MGSEAVRWSRTGGVAGRRRYFVVLNAAAAVVAGGKAPDLESGILVAQDSIDTGAARGKLEALRAFGR